MGTKCTGLERAETTHPPAVGARQSRSLSTLLPVVLALLLVKLALLLRGRILVLLVLRHQVVHVGLCLRELHLVHALARVPMQEGLAAEHGSEILCHALEHFLDSCRVAGKRDRHFETLR